jgi:hypothetical protein
MENATMRHVMTSFRTQSSRGLTIRQGTLRSASSLLAIAGILGLGSAFAEEPKDAAVKKPTKAVHGKAETETVAIPACLEKLKLTSEQHDKITESVRKYDASLDSVWKQFSSRYMQAIAMESSLLAAIEDNFTEAQRQQVRDRRHKTAHTEKDAQATNEKPNQATAKPASAVEDDIAGVGITLTSEQEVAADKVQEKYRSTLRSLNRDIQGLHIRLVSLEADKLVAMEKILTKDQLAQLRLHRQNAPDAPKVLIGQNASTKAE